MMQHPESTRLLIRWLPELNKTLSLVESALTQYPLIPHSRGKHYNLPISLNEPITARLWVRVLPGELPQYCTGYSRVQGRWGDVEEASHE